MANIPARYQAFRVSVCPPARAALDARVAGAGHGGAERLRATYPRPRLWKKFDTPGFGAGRNARFGDLDGDGVLDMLVAQNIPRVQGDAFDHISALTAVTLEGRVLWQSGRPDRRNALLTNDTPFQIHDLDGDGRAEVVLVRDFKLQVLDGRTGGREAIGSHAAHPRRRAGASLRAVQRRLHRVRELHRSRPARHRPEGPLPELLGLLGGPSPALAGIGRHRPLPLPLRRGWRRARRALHRALAVGPHGPAALEPAGAG